MELGSLVTFTWTKLVWSTRLCFFFYFCVLSSYYHYYIYYYRPKKEYNKLHVQERDRKLGVVLGVASGPGIISRLWMTLIIKLINLCKKTIILYKPPNWSGLRATRL